MKVMILGLGYVGFTSACCISSQGHAVIGIDPNGQKLADIAKGHTPIVEPKVGEMLTDALGKDLIKVDAEIDGHVADCDIALVCVGTPSAADGSHNMGFIADVTRQLAAALKETTREAPLVIAYRSTFRPGTVEELVLPILRASLGDKVAEMVRVVYMPEFLREGTAVDDYFAPPKIVVGTADGQPDPAITALNEGIEAPVFVVGYREAEITKFVDNTWHAVKVAFANEVGRTCLGLGISASQVHEIFVSDTKLNVSPYYLRPGGAFGGSCLPKDVRALQHIGADSGANLHLVDSLIRSNEAHKHRLFEYTSDGLEPGAKILLAGLAFKAGTDDLRESPNVDLARKLLGAGFDLEIYDPAIDAGKLVGANLGYAFSQLPVLEKLLVDKAHVESTGYDRVIASNATVRELALAGDTDVRNIGTLP